MTVANVHVTGAEVTVAIMDVTGANWMWLERTLMIGATSIKLELK